MNCALRHGGEVFHPTQSPCQPGLRATRAMAAVLRQRLALRSRRLRQRNISLKRWRDVKNALLDDSLVLNLTAICTLAALDQETGSRTSGKRD